MVQPIVTENTIIQGCRIAYGVHGSGKPAVLLHGTPSSSIIWRNIVPKLVEAGFKVHVFDLLGYGLSERPWDPSVDTSMTGQVTILESLLSLWGLDTTHVIAHDIGGGIAQRFAVFSPHRVLSLTLIDVVSFDSYPSKRTKQQMQIGLEALTKADSDDHRTHFREWLLQAVENPQKLEQSALDDYLNYISGPIGQPSLFQHQVRHYDPKHTMEVAPRLGELGDLPVQLIWGANDAWQVVDWAHKLHEAIPGSELTIVQDAGHFSLEDQPEQISQILLKFLSRL
ncbi:pisatin demethylase [Penicillium argentinense]|uniref:Pisatin demethylase n=1 Tax=Penicillium argentinense TaxID=1131581 RepID=A0A9W9FFV9_9EURO|nr:pisatin demethylase [Penicillium argentinense]KAJ5099411.1 pisatin demethylase [Penicillium argentinense]